jgi:hypothetical protein
MTPRHHRTTAKAPFALAVTGREHAVITITCPLGKPHYGRAASRWAGW